MKSAILSILAVMSIFQSCVPVSNNLTPDETAKTVFSPNELQGLEEMVKFVDDEISQHTNASEINQRYHAYFDSLAVYVSNGEMFPALFRDTTKFRFLETINDEAFSAIWRMDDYVKILKYKDTTFTDLHGLKALELNPRGKYMHYLKEVGKSDSRYSDLYNSIEVAGDISPSTVTWFPVHHREFDFTSFKDRLWATVFLLRMGDPIDEKVERYLKEKDLQQKK